MEREPFPTHCPLGKRKPLKKLQALGQLLRLPATIIAALAGCATLYALRPELPVSSYVLTALTLMLMNSGAFAINDYWDVEKDRIDHPERPLPSGRLSRLEVFWVSLLLFSGALLVSISLGRCPFLLVLTCVVLLWHYSLLLRYSGILGNGVVATIVAAIVFLGSLVAERPWALAYGIGFTFFYALAKEIVWDIHDCKGDRNQGIMTIANRWGAAVAFRLSWGILALLFVSIPLAILGLPMAAPGLFAGFAYLMLASLSIGILNFQLDRSNQSYGTLIQWGRLSMVCGLIALLGTPLAIA